jgi:hypothetical protein
MTSTPAAGRAPEDPGAITFRWDLDKTYLRTDFENLRALVRIPFEAGSDKEHLPGVPELIQGLRRVAEEGGLSPYVFFLTASPPQIGGAIREKLELDGIVHDGITFKDQLGNLMRGRWGRLREQVGYKLVELLQARANGPAARREFLFGDDWEGDPLIYSLYADILAGLIDAATLERVIAKVDVGRDRQARALELADELSGSAPDAVERIFINLERRTPPSRFRRFGARLVPTFNAAQTAAVLVELGCLDLPGFLTVAGATIESDPRRGTRLRNSIDDLTRRGHLDLTVRDRLVRRLAKAGLVKLSADEKALRSRLRTALARVRRTRRVKSVGPGADWDGLLQKWSAD